MDKKETIQFLRAQLDEIPTLAKLPYDNSDYPLWRIQIEDVLENVFNRGSVEYKRFAETSIAYRTSSRDRSTEKKEYLYELELRKTAILSIIKKYEILETEEKPAAKVEPPEDTAELPIYLFNKMQFHPRVIAASKSLFRDGHYASAILEAYKAVNNFVKKKTNLALDGKALMSKVFSEDVPVIKLNELLTQSDRDEQEGFKFLFMGAMVGIRNPKAHDNVIQTDPYRTLEYLGLASLLMRRIEEGKVVRLQKNVKTI